jgi:ATP-dependent helicase HrpB
MSRLVTERVSRAEAEQRRGRAGRVAPGICYRMWARAEEGALPEFAPPEIAVADLTGLALELANWGSDGADLAFLTPPPEAALTEARALLKGSWRAGPAGRITPHGRALVGAAGASAHRPYADRRGPRRGRSGGADGRPRPAAGVGADLSLRLRDARLSGPARHGAGNAAHWNASGRGRAAAPLARTGRRCRPARWRRWPIPTGSGCAARAISRAICCRAGAGAVLADGDPLAAANA